MRKFRSLKWATSIAILILASLACGGTSAPTKPTTPIASISIGRDLTSINVCQAVPRADIEAVLGHKLAKAPEHFEYYDTTGSSGCWYKAAQDSNGAAHFGYIVFTRLDAYNNQPLYENQDVAGFGREAYFNNGADARQLWVKVDDNTAFVVAFGDVPREDGAKEIAALLLAAIK